MDKEEAVQAALQLLQQAGIHASVVRIYGSTTEAVIVLPEVCLAPRPGARPPMVNHKTQCSVVLDT